MSKTKIQEDAPYILEFEEFRKYVPDCQIETNGDRTLVTFYDTDNSVGMFRRSDFIICYNDDGYPVIITERIHRSNYSWFEWLALKRQLRAKHKNLFQEYGLDISIDFTHANKYIDYTHFREDQLCTINLNQLWS